MAGIFPAGGVAPGAAINSTTTPPAEGCDALFHRSGCRPAFDPASLNALISEVVNLGGCSDTPYDCTRLDNLCLMINALINSRLSLFGRTRIYYTSDVFTVPAGITSFEAELWGGGGAGGASGNGGGGGVAGNAGGGGGGGGYVYRRVSGVTGGDAFNVIVGMGGVPASGAAGGDGGDTSLGILATAGGGQGGANGSSTAGDTGIGGTATGGDLNVPGGRGGLSGPNTTTVTVNDVLRIYAKGGMAAGGLSTAQLGGTGSPGAGFGSGGTGASGGSGFPGGAGAPGLVIIRW